MTLFQRHLPDGYGSPDLGHDFCYLDTTGIAHTYLLILMGGFSTHSDPNVMAPHHSNDGSAYKDLSY